MNACLWGNGLPRLRLAVTRENGSPRRTFVLLAMTGVITVAMTDGVVIARSEATKQSIMTKTWIATPYGLAMTSDIMVAMTREKVNAMINCVVIARSEATKQSTMMNKWIATPYGLAMTSDIMVAMTNNAKCHCEAKPKQSIMTGKWTATS